MGIDDGPHSMSWEHATSRPSLPSPVSRSGTPAHSGSTFATEELALLKDSSTHDQAEDHEYQTAPVLTQEAFVSAGFTQRPSQYGVLGAILSINGKGSREVPSDPRLYFNTNAPLSAIICGVQGSGKSHTVSVLLENMLIPRFSPIGATQKALSALVLHFGEGGKTALPNETAWLASSSIDGVSAPPVQVYVSPSQLSTMRQVYGRLGKVVVEPLRLSEEELDAQAFLSLMAVGSSDNAPLYMQTVLSILRDMGENFTYAEFKARLEGERQGFNPAQRAGLKLRMQLLEGFLDTANMKHGQSSRFAEGRLTIIDLSDPFIDPAAACGLFEVITRIFIRADIGTGKVLVVDEAHKYLAANKGNSGLTKALQSLIRQQRHLAMRVVISTQEPTVVPAVLLDLCSLAILHRFSSPAWWEHVAKHVSANVSEETFDQIVKLRTGEAIVLAPSGLGMVRDTREDDARTGNLKRLTQFGRRYLIIKSRQRITADGGTSILVV
ncbi:uncharacterized protein LAESUDRAFT_808383 [Laetiporus sulphureus 93-53]|uniref:Zona occludens toxin N-terminal domain-containing protein n=1 Tax=Laetiporus sulphureus 93-53 TaxID=1314785 RepID=A0A165IBX1_9APHY|nr:uncharacterized protein LAESUDRAFT_808383 [Laetiporus sulphureus 93-53]KZT12865.1 hypothetical protein LAESUDRAFT_808383 [Laetiporus sulphureus 93-53]